MDLALFEHLTDDERAELDALLSVDVWVPLPGPQSMAYSSEADIIGYGGAAGGGKTDLACGKALTQHRKSMILRRVGTELTGVIDRLEELIGSKDGFNGQQNIWRLPDRGLQIEFGAVPNPGDERKYQGRPHDLLVFDEATNFLAQQVRFLLGWLRTTIPGQKCQALLTFNPPTNAEGRWVVDFFAPWLDPNFGNPAEPGELRYAASLPADAAHPNGRDLWVADGRSFVMEDGQPAYDFDPAAHKPDEIIKPLARTFIPSRITDNPHLLGTGYMATLQALPEPLRSQMLRGDFLAGVEDDPWQVIPTAWVETAQARWKLDPDPGVLHSMGVDVARGGRDKTCIARRYGDWFAEPVVKAGSETPNGPSVVGLMVGLLRNGAPAHIDVIGPGSSVYDFALQQGINAIPMNGASGATDFDKTGQFKFVNRRSELWWRMREALDPDNGRRIALPPDKTLKADLCAPRYDVRKEGIAVERKEDLIKRIGRSPDLGDAFALALVESPLAIQKTASRVRPVSAF